MISRTLLFERIFPTSIGAAHPASSPSDSYTRGLAAASTAPRPGVPQRLLRVASRERARLLALACAPIIAILLSEHARHWLIETFATLCIVGGFIAAPTLTLLGWVGLATPIQAPLHRISETLIIAAVIWLALAFISAHLHHDFQRRVQQRATATDGANTTSRS